MEKNKNIFQSTNQFIHVLNIDATDLMTNSWTLIHLECFATVLQYYMYTYTTVYIDTLWHIWGYGSYGVPVGHFRDFSVSPRMRFTRRKQPKIAHWLWCYTHFKLVMLMFHIKLPEGKTYGFFIVQRSGYSIMTHTQMGQNPYVTK